MTDKITLGSIASFQNDATAVTQYNANSAIITAGMDNTLSRDGTSPNQMGSSLDMNSNQIINLPAPSSANSPVRLADVSSNSIPVLFTSPANTLKGNNTGSTANTADLTVAQVLGMQQSLMCAVFAKGVNFNSANTDTVITLPPLPTGAVGYSNFTVRIANASAINTTSTFGLFSGAGGTGLAFLTGTAGAINNISVNTAGNCSATASGIGGTVNYTLPTLFFRVQTAQGSPCTADVTIQLVVQY